ncbi:MAG: hypothetical protein NC924_06070 [Candidatus Omnitrophica bacterium]|nr:hypothetical protein [Candidatus Omnitrophota bacterium]
MTSQLLDVTLLNPEKIVFAGKAGRVIVPGEQGVFEILPFHKRLVSRLLSGTIIIDEQSVPIYRGIVQVDGNSVTVIMEEKRAAAS